MTLQDQIERIGEQAREASASLMSLSTAKKNAVLARMAELLLTEVDYIQSENQRDLVAGKEKGLSDAMLDRLALTDSVIGSMVQGLNEVIALPDPIGMMSNACAAWCCCYDL